jgi:hypothetical protein
MESESASAELRRIRAQEVARQKKSRDKKRREKEQREWAAIQQERVEDRSSIRTKRVEITTQTTG